MQGQQKTYTGGCLCGHIRFTLRAEPFYPHLCSCKMCQRHSGALTLAWVVADKDKVAWDGPGGAPATWRASEASSRAFCPTCGSTLGCIDDAPTVGLVLGTFDANDDAGLRPGEHTFSEALPDWWHAEAGVAA